MLPDGRRRVNPDGIDFYRRLCERLHEHGVRPLATLYHWDLPEALHAEGGWARATSRALRRLRAADVRRLGDLVHDWVTVNEPWGVSFLGHALGIKAPGRRDWPEAVRVGHHLLLAHARAVERTARAAGAGGSGSRST